MRRATCLHTWTSGLWSQRCEHRSLLIRPWMRLPNPALALPIHRSSQYPANILSGGLPAGQIESSKSKSRCGWAGRNHVKITLLLPPSLSQSSFLDHILSSDQSSNCHNIRGIILLNKAHVLLFFVILEGKIKIIISAFSHYSRAASKGSKNPRL